MKLGTFHGGIHPYDGKELSKDIPISILEPKGDMVYPMSQHIGAPAKPAVAVGDSVLVGQCIGEAQGMISANVISSVSGTVKAIEPRLIANGTEVTSIVIENDSKYETVEGIGKDRDYTMLTPGEIRDIIKEAGIVGMGGAGFPTHVKLTPKNEDRIDTIIVNGAECEPYLTSDYRMMIEEPEKIIGGLRIILSLFKNAHGVIGIENNKPEAIEKLTTLAAGETNIRIQPLKTRYPQGGERSMIYAITGREVNSSMLPADAGCVVDNIDTVIAIYMAVAKSTPLIRRIITVTGDAITKPQNFNVKTGTDYTQLLEAAGGFKQEPEKILSGGPMMGQALFNLNIPVSKTSSALTCFIKDPVALAPETACIRCGRCVTVCPSRLVPQMMMRVSLNRDLKGFEKLYGMECIECGCCSYACPASRPLTQSFKEMKRLVAADRKAKKAAQEVKK